jgi:four helix bundle protein
MPQFDHEKLDVYRLSIQFVGWADQLTTDVNGSHRYAREQLARAASSIPLNIAEGNAKRQGKDRCRFFEIARGSATECAAALDVMVSIRAVPEPLIADGKAMLVRIVSMLTKLAPPE